MIFKDGDIVTLQSYEERSYDIIDKTHRIYDQLKLFADHFEFVYYGLRPDICIFFQGEWHHVW